REAERLDPENGQVHLRLAVALYHEGDAKAAGEELDAAAQHLGEDRAELQLYRGLLRLQGGDAAGAAPALERARSPGPALRAPLASYYAALAWSSAHDSARAHADL